MVLLHHSNFILIAMTVNDFRQNYTPRQDRTPNWLRKIWQWL